MRLLRSTILSAGLLGLSALTSGANALIISSANLFLPLLPIGSTNTFVGVQGVSTPSQTTLIGSGYTITFNGVDSNQGIVQGTVPSTIHAVPVAGVTPGLQPTYLTGDFGSSQTSNPLLSGNYLSTGTGSITVSFDTPQISLALLWGSIDASNTITFGNTAGDTLTGMTVQALAAGFASNGFQGPRGSAYVVSVSDTPFSFVTFSSDVVSFEFDAVVASLGTITTVPLPASAPMFGAALLALAGFSYGMNRWVAPKDKKVAAAA